MPPVKGKRNSTFQKKANRYRKGKNRTRYYPVRKCEFKSIDVTVESNNEVDTTGAFYLMNGCARGDDIDDRDGRIITMWTGEVRGSFNAGSAQSSAQMVRMIMFYDKQSNGAGPALADVIFPGSVWGQRTLANRSRFKILKDETFIVASGSTANNGGLATNIINFHFYYRLPKNCQRVTFNSGTAGSVADIETGSLYLLFLGDTATTTNNTPTVTYTSRVRFTDA